MPFSTPPDNRKIIPRRGGLRSSLFNAALTFMSGQRASGGLSGCLTARPRGTLRYRVKSLAARRYGQNANSGENRI